MFLLSFLKSDKLLKKSLTHRRADMKKDLLTNVNLYQSKKNTG